MKRVITSLSLLLLLLCGATAQSISQYEYWTDDDYASRSVVDSSEDDVSLNVSTEGLNAGIHFLNFRACRSDGVWGNFYRYLYYIPVLNSVEEGNLNVEYWLDDDLAGKRSDEPNDGSLSMAIDVSSLEPGVHYFNCTPVSSASGRGISERYLFYVPMHSAQTSVAAVVGYEYWFDDDYAAVVKKESAAGEQMLTLSLDGLTSGVHYFNCRAVNERGEYGNPVREMFFLPDTKMSSGTKLASYEYWIDDDYANCVKGTSENAEQAFTIDVSQLPGGVHYFNYWPIDDKGCRGNAVRQLFYIARTSGTGESETLEYEYWIDDDVANKVTGKGTQADYVFNIDVSSLALGIHTFSFKAKNLLDQWTDVFVDSFEVSEPATLLGDVNNDGVVDIVDVANLISHLAGHTPDGFNLEAANVNNDEAVDSADVEELVKLILNK